MNTDSVRLYRKEPTIPDGETANAKVWQIGVGGPTTNNTFGVISTNAAGAVTSFPIFIQPVGGLAGEIPNGYNIGLDYDAEGGVHIGKFINVGGHGGAGNGQLAVNNVKVLGPQEPAITDVASAAGAPTQAEFNALVTSYNTLLASLRAATGHGLIA